MSTAPTVDWERIELQYRAGLMTLREIASEHGITHAAVTKRAKRDGWARDLNAKIQAKAAVVLKQKTDAKEAAAQRPKAGFVYVIYIEDSSSERYYKIGMSETFSARFSSHQCASPFDICVACAYFVPDMRTEERVLHGIFAGKRVRGEWFRLDSEDIRTIAARAALA